MEGKILHCSCVGVAAITAKSAASKTKAVCTNIPFDRRNAGAEYQDKKFGAGMRLHNPGVKDGKLKNWNCTVCGGKKVA